MSRECPTAGSLASHSGSPSIFTLRGPGEATTECWAERAGSGMDASGKNGCWVPGQERRARCRGRAGWHAETPLKQPDKSRILQKASPRALATGPPLHPAPWRSPGQQQPPVAPAGAWWCPHSHNAHAVGWLEERGPVQGWVLGVGSPGLSPSASAVTWTWAGNKSVWEGTARLFLQGLLRTGQGDKQIIWP